LDGLVIEFPALYLIAAPSTPEAVKREVLERARHGEPMTRAKALEVLEDYESRAELPSPSVARQIAIATGAHTMANTGFYMPPVSKEVSEAHALELKIFSELYDALEVIAETTVTPEEMVTLGKRHAGIDLESFAERALAWIQLLIKEVNRREG
jgi:hypothetical protein